MGKLTIITPAQGSRIIRDDRQCILVGQPPEVLKGLLNNGITSFDTMVLTDVRERRGSLINNLEFPFYFFLFFAKGLQQGRKLNLVGDPTSIGQALRLLRFTLMGPTRTELDNWGTSQGLKNEWLAVADAIALKNGDGNTIPIEDFFNLHPFVDDEVTIDDVTISHIGEDHYRIANVGGDVDVNLNHDGDIEPGYHVQRDYVPGGLTKMGLEILGGASGFTPDEPCTGLALCYNGDYILIDSIPFLDQHLFARGISKNQVSACFLTHLHDDHCAMFPLMLMPHRVEIITTREIFNMAMEKLACSLGWNPDVVASHFKLVEVRPGESFNYFGLNILPHVTVHSVPTIGATFSCIHQGYERRICVVGDNNSMTTVRELHGKGIVRRTTLENLERLYTDRFSLLVADGGAGEIHGDPADAIESDADRVLFVHVEHLPSNFNTTFSLARSGKRYTVIEGDSSLYTSQVNHYLTEWLGEPFPNRWMRSLLAEEEIRRYNQDDVLIVQGTDTRGYVYVILTGYCDVVQHDGEQFRTVAKLQAGDLLGEMAVISGIGTRNASVVATTPVTVCVFAEETFGAFIKSEGFAGKLKRRWSLRPALKYLPQFREMTSTTIERVGNAAELLELPAGQSVDFTRDAWFIQSSGTLVVDGEETGEGAEFGQCPFATARTGTATAATDAKIVVIENDALEGLVANVPQFNYYLRKQRHGQAGAIITWELGDVTVS